MVGPRLGGGRAPAARRRDRARVTGCSSRSTSSRTADARRDRRRDVAVPRRVRRARRLRLPAARLARRPTGRRCAPQIPSACGSSPARRRSASRRRRLRRRLHLHFLTTTARQVPAPLRAGARRSASSARRASARATTAAAPASAGRPRPRERRDLRRALDGGARRERRHRDDHELQRVGRGHADRAGRSRAAATRGYDGAWGLTGDAAADRLPHAHARLEPADRFAQPAGRQ